MVLDAPSPVRRAIPADLPQLLELYAELHPRDEPPTLTPGVEPVWTQMLAQPGLSCLVLELDDRLVSTCCLVVVPNLTHGARPYGLIENVVTRAEQRRSGHGSAIVRHALALAWDEGCYKVMLFTGSRRPEVLRFYERCGFVLGDKQGLVARPD